MISLHQVVPEYFVFNFPSTVAPADPATPHFVPCYNYPTTPCTPVTPNADIPGSPFDVFTNYHQFKYEEHIEPGTIALTLSLSLFNYF